MFSKAVLRQLIKHSNIWEAPKSKYLDFTSIPFHAVRVCCENSLQWREFESAWKQILVPTGTFKDIFKWSGNVRAQSLLRRMYLQHAYGSTEIFNSAVNKGYSDPLVFPSRDEVVDHFDMSDWSRCSDDEGGEDISKEHVDYKFARRKRSCRSKLESREYTRSCRMLCLWAQRVQSVLRKI